MNTYYSEDQRWPSKSQRFGWLIGMGVAIFIAFQLNLHLFAPLVAFPVLIVLLFLLLGVLTLQQRLTLRIGAEDLNAAVAPVVGRFWRRASRAVPRSAPAECTSRVPVLTITYRFKSPISALAPGRRGSRVGWLERQVSLAEVERWYAGRMPAGTPLLRAGRTFPVGFHRDAVAIILASGEKLTIPTRDQAAFLEALSTAKVDSVRQERAAPQPVREEL